MGVVVMRGVSSSVFVMILIGFMQRSARLATALHPCSCRGSLLVACRSQVPSRDAMLILRMRTYLVRRNSHGRALQPWLVVGGALRLRLVDERFTFWRCLIE